MERTNYNTDNVWRGMRIASEIGTKGTDAMDMVNDKEYKGIYLVHNLNGENKTYLIKYRETDKGRDEQLIIDLADNTVEGIYHTDRDSIITDAVELMDRWERELGIY